MTMPAHLPVIELGRAELDRFDAASEREWLVTNGLGGYAAGTVAGTTSRRYHGLLVAALKPPVERTVMVAKLEILADYDGRRYGLTSNEYADGTVDPQGFRHLQSFRLEGLLPVWEYTVADARLEQRICMEQGANRTHVKLSLLRGSVPAILILRPLCAYRDYHSHGRGQGWAPDVRAIAGGCEVHAYPGATPYRITADGGSFAPGGAWFWNVRHRAEARRGLDEVEDLFCPGEFTVTLAPGESVMLTLCADQPAAKATPHPLRAETERQQALLAGLASDTPDWIRRLVVAADQFLVARGTVGGRTVIAGYPWFSDWGRDTMIALPGLTLSTGRHEEAASILRTFGGFVSEGMLPNRFPDAGETPEYNTVDATLWYFHAIDEYLRHTGDESLIHDLYPVLADIIEWHLKGTRYGIRVDTDGLLYAGEPGVQLTWMDAKVGDWVVTPRIGKAVEINALWYHALVVMQSFAADLRDKTAVRRYASLAGRVLASFRSRFWNADGGYLYDVIDAPDGKGPQRVDTALRPNQIFAVSVNAELLEQKDARAVVDVCARRLWTPHGLRSLDAQDPQYVGHYGGGPWQRDGAYHQGTVWSWLLGPFALAHYRVYGDAAAACAWLDGMRGHLSQACVGSISEIFDGDPPHAPEGCFAQAWSVAEVLRAWMNISADAAAGSRTQGGVQTR